MNCRNPCSHGDNTCTDVNIEVLFSSKQCGAHTTCGYLLRMRVASSHKQKSCILYSFLRVQCACVLEGNWFCSSDWLWLSERASFHYRPEEKPATPHESLQATDQRATQGCKTNPPASCRTVTASENNAGAAQLTWNGDGNILGTLPWQWVSWDTPSWWEQFEHLTSVWGLVLQYRRLFFVSLGGWLTDSLVANSLECYLWGHQLASSLISITVKPFLG